MTDNGPRDFSLEIATLTAIMGRSPDVNANHYLYWTWYPLSPPCGGRGLRVDYWCYATIFSHANTWTFCIDNLRHGLLTNRGFDDVIKRLTNDADLRAAYIEKPR